MPGTPDRRRRLPWRALLLLVGAPCLGTSVQLVTPVAHQYDDAEQEGSSLSQTSSDLDIVPTQLIGLRFELDVPPSTAVASAYIQFTADETHADAISVEVRVELADDPPQFLDTNLISTRTLSDEAVAWSPAAWTVSEAGEAQRTPELRSLVQAVLDRPGWARGNAIVFVISCSAGGKRAAESYDGSYEVDGVRAQAPALVLEVSYPPRPPSIPPAPPVPPAPPPLPTLPYSPLRFVAIGDFGSASADEDRVASAVDLLAPEIVITVGDNRYSGSGDYNNAVGKQYCQYIAGGQPGSHCAGNVSAVNRFFPATGNHDYSDEGGIQQYLDYFTLPGAGVPTSGTTGSELYYDHIHRHVHFFAVDSDTRSTVSIATQQASYATASFTSSAGWEARIFARWRRRCRRARRRRTTTTSARASSM